MGLREYINKLIPRADPGPITEDERYRWCRTVMRRWTPDPTEMQVQNFKWLCDNGFYFHNVTGTFVKRFPTRWLEIKRHVYMTLPPGPLKDFVKRHEFMAENPLPDKEAVS